MDEDERPFIVVKFLPTPDDDNVYYEVAVAKWLVEIDEKMMGKLLWPKNNATAGKLVRVEARANETWQQFDVEVKRYYATYIAARNAAKGFEKFASAYDSDSGCQMGRGKRKKKTNRFLSCDDSSDCDSKKCKQSKSGSKIPATPLSPLSCPSSLTKSFSVASKENIPTLTVVSNKKQKKTATASPVPATDSNQHNLLHKIVNLRQQAVDKAQQQKETMSLENVRKLIARKKTADSTLCFELPVKTSETNGNYKSTSQSSIEPYSSSHINKMSTDICSHSLCWSSHETLNSCLSTPSTSNYTHQQTLPREFEFVAIENRSETDTDSDEPLLVPSQPASTSKSQSGLASKITTDLDTFLMKLDQKVDNMQAKLDMILMNQSKLNRILLPEEKILSKPPNMPALPLDTLEQFEMFEKFLSNDVNLSDTCYYLKSLPLGNDETRAMSKLMSNLMSNSLAYMFNFDGHGTKLAFKSTKLWELVQGTLLLRFEESDLSEALKSLRSWLRNAKGRKG